MAKLESTKKIAAPLSSTKTTSKVQKTKSTLKKKMPSTKSGESKLSANKVKSKIAAKTSNTTSTSNVSTITPVKSKKVIKKNETIVSEQEDNQGSSAATFDSLPNEKVKKETSTAKTKTKPQRLTSSKSLPVSATVKVQKSDPESTVFVGNIANNTKRKQLQVLFEKFGKVLSVRLRTIDGKRIFKQDVRKTAESLNAYVVMENPECARKALELSGSEFKGRHIRVNPSINMLTAIDSKRTIFVGNLKYSATDEKLHEIFSACGDIEYVRTLRNPKGCSGVAYVCYKKSEAIPLALELNNTLVDERPIRVNRYVKPALNAQKVPGKKENIVTGAARRILAKNKTNVKGTTSKVPLSSIGSASTTAKKPKKSDYRGVKTGIKKTVKKKIVKSTQLKTLAKKIAPKT